MSIKLSFDNITDWLAAKSAGHFTIERWGTSWAINVHRARCPLETILAKSPGEINRLRQKPSDEGLCGYIGKGG